MELCGLTFCQASACQISMSIIELALTDHIIITDEQCNENTILEYVRFVHEAKKVQFCIFSSKTSRYNTIVFGGPETKQ